MNKIWIAGALACVSAVAMAQSDQTKEKAPTPSQTASPRDVATGQATGKRMHKPLTVTSDDSSSRLLPTVNKVSASDDWQAKSAKSSDPKPGSAQVRVAAGDVNGDGVADATAKNSGHATETMKSPTASSNVAQPRDAATGQASGKRQHQPLTIKKEVDAASPQK